MNRFWIRIQAGLGAAVLVTATAAAQGLPVIAPGSGHIHSQQPPSAWPPKASAFDPLRATAGQWTSATAFGGWATTRIRDAAGVVLAGSPDPGTGPTRVIAPSFTPVDAAGVAVPSARVQLTRVKMARPLVGRAATVFFGEVIPPPLVDAQGQPVPEGTFRPEPQNAAGGNFYYSPHARAVFATQPGVVNITWAYADSSREPSTLQLQYVVSPTPRRAAKRIFWTEKGFKGPVVEIPRGPISKVNVRYNSDFPAQVTEEFQSPFDVPSSSPFALPPERRTLWFEPVDRSLRAYNREGRVFMELLGPQKEDGSHQYLGTEVVEVIREVPPAAVRTPIGEKVLPPDGDPSLHGQVVNGLLSQPPFLHSQPVPSRNRIDYYAVATTTQSVQAPQQPSGEVLLYWKETGAYAIQWPKYYAAYIITWPQEAEAYSTYVRPSATSEKAEATGVRFDNDNTSALVFQDDPSGAQAEVKDGLVFFTRLDASDPEARTLIRHSAGEAVWFERVLSRLDTEFPGYKGAPLPAEVGARIEPPSGHEEALGYIHQPSGTAFDPGAYKNPFVSGTAEARQGAIIGVNARPGANLLEVWWYRANSPPPDSGIRPMLWPSTVQKYALRWPSSPSEIVLASNSGSGELPSLQAAGEIYIQNNPAAPGFNPNDEHALMAGGRAWALRDDLGSESTSLPHVLLRYAAEDGRPAMRVFRVLREKPEAGLVFRYAATAGTVLQSPMPLPLLPVPRLVDGSSPNVPVPAAGAQLPAPGLPSNYGKFTFKDRKHTIWVSRGPATPQEDSEFAMQYYYPAREGFYLPGVGEATPGEVLPYLRRTDAAGQPIGAVRGAAFQALPVRFVAAWPQFAPQLRIGETLTLPRQGLPAVRGQSSLQVVYDQSLALSGPQSVNLIDPTRARTHALSATGLSKIPESVVTSDYQGRTWFPNLPPHLSQRFYFERSRGELGSLVFIGEFKKEAFGDDWLLLNILTPQDAAALKGLCASDDASAAQWAAAIDGLSTTMETFAEHPSRKGTFIPNTPVRSVLDVAERDKAWQWIEQHYISPPLGSLPPLFSKLQQAFSGKTAEELAPLWKWITTQRDELTSLDSGWQVFGGLTPDPARAAKIQQLKDQMSREVFVREVREEVTRTATQVAEVADSDTAVDSYALAAAGGGAGWVVLASGNGRAFTKPDEPVSLHVLRVTAPLGRGELKVIQPSNPLSEKLTLQQSLDLGAQEQKYEFEWRYAPPADGTPPVLYTLQPDLLFEDGAWTHFSAAGTSAPVMLPGSVSAHRGSGGEVPLLERTFQVPRLPLRLYLSVATGAQDGLQVLINGSAVAALRFPGIADTATSRAPAGSRGLPRVYEIPAAVLQPGPNRITLRLSTAAEPGSLSYFNARLEGLLETENLAGWLAVTPGAGEVRGERPGSIRGKTRHIIEGPGIFTLTDNYFICRYRAVDPANTAHDPGGGWSKWTEPQLAEGWIKRALAGINPFEQRVKDLYNSDVNTDVSMLTQAGRRWEGDIALNLANINQFGLIEIYETILRRGKMLSIEGAPPMNYGPANDALLLAAGYLNDLYMILGNEAYADAANPTIAYSTESGAIGDVASSLFAFKGQLSSVLDEELGLLRGRDDFLPPGARTAPVYNRLVWNFTRGIDSGEAVYALNYNIKDLNGDGGANALDAAIAFPQGHGDAYGHYLTALTNYYGLLRSSHFDWMPRSEAVLLLGKPVAVDYFDERKFAAAAAALGRTSVQVLELTHRKAYNPSAAASATASWSHLGERRVNARTGITRSWSVDDWATRGGQGAMLHWLTANSMLPEVDPDPSHEGIQKIDRTTVPELAEIVIQGSAIQQVLDAADARMNPLGISGGALPFDISPSAVDAGETHFEQVYGRAVSALGNAAAAFHNARTATQLLRSQEDSLALQRDALQAQERVFQAQLVDLYGTPYPEDIGPGRTYPQGYVGPDYYHYMYVDMPELFKNTAKDDAEGRKFDLRAGVDFQDLRLSDSEWMLGDQGALPEGGLGTKITYELAGNGMFRKPSGFGRRARPGQLQDAISELMMARMRLHNAVEDYEGFGVGVRRLVQSYKSTVRAHEENRSLLLRNALVFGGLELTTAALEKVDASLAAVEESVQEILEAMMESLPTVLGMASDPSFAARASLASANAAKKGITGKVKLAIEFALKAIELVTSNMERAQEIEALDIAWRAEHAQLQADLKAGFEELANGTRAVDEALRSYEDAERRLRALTYDASQLLAEREVHRRRASALIQGHRTRDLGFRAFRNEALESYKALFDLSSRYTFLAARCYDYETGLADAAGNSTANGFFQQIVQSRALGVLDGAGQPLPAGAQGGDPGLSGALARLRADWSVVRSRLGFNNPDRYGTTFSLRREKERILPAAEGDTAWREVLAASRMDNILADDDVRRYCMQVNSTGALTVPGFVIPFQTTITEGYNFFGQPLAAGDSNYSPTSFATKVRSVGVAFDGYIGMSSPTAIGGAIESLGGQSPPDPGLAFTDPNGLSATPYIYLIAAGEDSMRSPPLGDQSTVRTWQVEDQAIPLPFDVGGAALSGGMFSAADSLRERFGLRKHQAFRAVPGGTVFSSAPGFTNSRLIGRSVWNSRWKLVIPGRTLLADPVKGMRVFQDTVKDIKIHLDTYSYSGN